MPYPSQWRDDTAVALKVNKKNAEREYHHRQHDRISDGRWNRGGPPTTLTSIPTHDRAGADAFGRVGTDQRSSKPFAVMAKMTSTDPVPVKPRRRHRKGTVLRRCGIDGLEDPRWSPSPGIGDRFSFVADRDKSPDGRPEDADELIQFDCAVTRGHIDEAGRARRIVGAVVPGGRETDVPGSGHGLRSTSAQQRCA